MKTMQIEMRRRQGSALLTVLLLVLLVPLVGGAIIRLAQQQSFTVHRQADMMRAKLIAEAGANFAYQQVAQNFPTRTNASAFPSTSYAGGTYDVTVQPLGTRAAVIISTGQFNSAITRVIMDIYNDGELSGVLPPTSPWAHSVFVNGTITLNGSGNVLGSVRCNSTVRQNGSIEWGLATNTCNVWSVGEFRANGVATIYGTVNAPIIDASGYITQRNVGPVATVPFPTVDLTPYYNIAVANGQVFSGGTYNSDVALGNIPGGICWYNGNVTFKKSCSFRGCVIATGGVLFNGSLTQRKYGNYPAIVSRDSEIQVNGSHTIEGLLYCKGDMRLNGSGQIDGSIVVGGNMEFNGSYGVVSYVKCEPGTGGSTNDANDNVYVSAWQE